MALNDSYLKVLLAVMFLCVVANMVVFFRPLHIQLYMLARDTHIVKELMHTRIFMTAKNAKNDIYYDFVIFTSFLRDRKRYVVYNNTKHNWPKLGRKMKAVLFTNDPDLESQFSIAGWDVLPESNVSYYGTPILKSMYLQIRKTYQASFIGFANADILFTNDLTDTLLAIKKNKTDETINLMATGRRTNVKNLTAEQASTFEYLEDASKKGVLFRADAEDYFFTDYKYPWETVPDLVIGRVAYDNFLLLHARMLNISTFDMTQTVRAVHQTVDNGHLEKTKLKKEFNYNKILIGKRFKGVNYYGGMTNCLSFVTVRRKGDIQIEKRLKLTKYCEFRTVDMITSKYKSRHTTRQYIYESTEAILRATTQRYL